MLSILELFSIGVGPSSSHTVGPMKAAARFINSLKQHNQFETTQKVIVHLYGSLALTGKGHGTDLAVLTGLYGFDPENIPESIILTIPEQIKRSKKILLDGIKDLNFDYYQDLKWHYNQSLSLHPNGLEFVAYDNSQKELLRETYYSIGGGFVSSSFELEHGQSSAQTFKNQVPYDFKNATMLLKLCSENNLSIARLVKKNELANISEQELKNNILSIWQAMDECIRQGCATNGILPSSLKVKRRAASLYDKISSNPDQYDIQTWLNVYAMAVNEQNAAFGRVVTAPTNGAAGIIPAVLKYYLEFNPKAKEEDIIDYFLTAGGIGILYKQMASISGAEVGCQGEVGVACSMAAAGLCAILGGDIYQVENAAEIGMEHNLGLTCDPIGGVVQIPCIERNAMAAVKAVNAAKLALMGDGKHHVHLDHVIAVMRQTGKDMNSIYKETSQGGLAVNHPEC